MSIFQICYASRATAPMSHEDLTALLLKSRPANHALGISGLLLYDQGSFIQLLEGPPDTVNSVCAKIRRDPRHDSIQILYKDTVEKPAFPDWAMGFCDLGNKSLQRLPGYSNFFNPDFSFADFRRNVEKTRLLFLQFRDGMWRRKLDFQPINAFTAPRSLTPVT